MKLLALIVALFMMSQASDELRRSRNREEDSGNLRNLGLPSKVVRQAEETEVDKLGEEPKNLRSLGLPKSQVKWERQSEMAKTMNADAVEDLSPMKKAKKLLERGGKSQFEVKNPKRLNFGWLEGITKGCKCDYHPGGCSISQAPAKGYGCYCSYQGAWTCGGQRFKCPSKLNCPADCYDRQCCLQGGGDCGGY